jgi:hypothetical protein
MYVTVALTPGAPSFSAIEAVTGTIALQVESLALGDVREPLAALVVYTLNSDPRSLRRVPTAGAVATLEGYSESAGSSDVVDAVYRTVSGFLFKVNVTPLQSVVLVTT